MRLTSLRRGSGIGLMIIAVHAAAARADYKQAVAYYNQKNYEKAIQELKADLDQNPDWEFGHRLAGLCYLALKNNALAVSSLSRASQLKSTAAATYLGLAQAYLAMQRYDNVIQSLNQGEAFLKTPDERYRFYHFRASALFRQEKFAEAANDYAAAIRVQGNDWTDFSQLGIAYYNQGKFDDAVQALQRAASMKPGQTAISEYMARAYLKQGAAALSAKQYGQALDLFKKSRDLNPNDGYVHYNVAEAYIFLKNYAEAEKSLNQAVTLLPKIPEVYLRLGLASEKLKKYDQAIAAYKKADELAPSPAIKEAIKRATEAKKQ
jgi:tetratricopeptide (TPR) repeat protein